MVETVVCTRLDPGLISLPSECKIPRDEKSDGTFCCALQLPMLIFLSKQLHTYFITKSHNMINEKKTLPVISLSTCFANLSKVK